VTNTNIWAVAVTTEIHKR